MMQWRRGSVVTYAGGRSTVVIPSQTLSSMLRLLLKRRVPGKEGEARTRH